MFLGGGVRDSPKTAVLVAVRTDKILNNIRVALANTNCELLHTKDRQETVAVLEWLKAEIAIAIIELELPTLDSWDLIGRLTWPERKPLKIIATTLIYPKGFFQQVKKCGVDAVVAGTIPPKEWHGVVESLLGEKINQPPNDAKAGLETREQRADFLRSQLTEAQRRYKIAITEYKRLAAIFCDTRNADSSLAFRQAFNLQHVESENYIRALKQFTDFTSDGKLPDELKPSSI